MNSPTRISVSASLCLLLLAQAPAQAADGDPIRAAIAEFLDARSGNLPGPARYDIGPIKTNVARNCRSMTVSMDAGARPWGRTHVNVRCNEGATWRIYVPVQIHVAVEYLVSARPLRAGQTIVEADLARRRGDLADLPAGILIDPAHAIGQTAGVSLPAERPLRADMLRQALVVKQGQSVKIVAGGTGFQVSGEGRALGNAVSGQVVQVRLSSGQVISGIAGNDGTVAVAH